MFYGHIDISGKQKRINPSTKLPKKVKNKNKRFRSYPIKLKKQLFGE